MSGLRVSTHVQRVQLRMQGATTITNAVHGIAGLNALGEESGGLSMDEKQLLAIKMRFEKARQRGASVNAIFDSMMDVPTLIKALECQKASK